MLYQVRAAFDELSDGREFSADVYEDTYLQHVGFLKEIEEGITWVMFGSCPISICL